MEKDNQILRYLDDDIEGDQDQERITNKYFPKNVCKFCQEVTWNYDRDTKKVKCKNCGKLGVKEIHTLRGARLFKVRHVYALYFEEQKELCFFPTWEKLQNELDELHKNGDLEQINKTEIEEVFENGSKDRKTRILFERKIERCFSE